MTRVSVNYNGTEYYYLRNGQGDIVGLIDGNGTKVVSYVYDSWGRLIETAGTLAGTLGADNPSTMSWLSNVLSISAWESSARFAAGCGVSNGITNAWSKVKSWVENLIN